MARTRSSRSRSPRVRGSAESKPLLIEEDTMNGITAVEHSAVIKVSDDLRLHISAYKWNPVKRFFAWLLILLTAGIVRLLLYWRPPWHMWLMCDKCTLNEAEIILLCDDHLSWTLRPVRTMVAPFGSYVAVPEPGGHFSNMTSVRFFTFRKLKYLWYPKLRSFAAVFSLDKNIDISLYHQLASNDRGLSEENVKRRFLIYGPNSIAVQLKPLLILLFREAISPFYVFQIFSVTLWYNDEYYYYATVIVLMSAISITLDVYQTRKTEKAIRDMVHTTDVVQGVRDGQLISLCSDQLVPGDLIHIPTHGCILQCDAVLMTGTCIVNESMLTGESVPVTKTSIPFDQDAPPGHTNIYSNKEHAKHSLYCGTHVLQTRFYSGQPVKALVIRTGYSTLKGQLVRSIMYPKPVDLHFTKDLFKFVGILACIAFVGFVYSFIIMVERGAGAKKIFLRSMDIITIVVPPALPAAMTIGIMAAQMRLRKMKIFCISPSTINTCGGINMVCFDKTGTLTEDGLDFHSAIPVENSKFVDEMHSLDGHFPRQGDLVRALASCHSLTRIDEELCGDPLDLILFEKTGWILEEPSVVEETGRFDTLVPTVVRAPKDVFVDGVIPGHEIGIIRQFTFSSSLQRMSVIARQLEEGQMNLYCKGAPEKIASLCLPQTVPFNFHEMVEMYAGRGHRLIAVGQRSLNLSFVKAQRIARDKVECELEFLGLVILENRLKPQTTPVIHQLRLANIRSVMVTGDNLQTAISVARECGILVKKRVYILDAPGENGSPNKPDRSTGLLLKQLGTDDNMQSTTASVVDLNQLESGIMPTGQEANYQIAMTGTTFGVVCHVYPQLIHRLVCVCDVFARMSPDQKALLINHAQELQYTVAMCGDGANDCGALKAAHAGISLSEAEASIASPFTSAIADIRCVPTVIREGRAALMTSFGIFKYMAGYSMTQFISVCLLYWIATNLADFQFLYIDLFLITTFAVFFGYTNAASELSPKPPPVRILSVPSVLSIVVQIIVVGLFQMFIFRFTAIQPWFMPFTDPGEEDNYYSYQGTTVFLVSLYQYIALAVVYSKGPPYRKPLFNNKALCISLVICTIFTLWITLYPPDFLSKFLNLLMPPIFIFRLLILFVSLICAIISYLAERWLVDCLLIEIGQKKKWPGMRANPNKYELMLTEIGHGVGWLKGVLKGNSQPRTPSPPLLLNERRDSGDDTIMLVVSDSTENSVTSF